MGITRSTNCAEARGWTRVTQNHVTPISSIENLGPDFGLLPVQYNQTSIGPNQAFAMAVSLKLMTDLEKPPSQKLDLGQWKLVVLHRKKAEVRAQVFYRGDRCHVTLSDACPTSSANCVNI